jgi:hypothetical protein
MKRTTRDLYTKIGNFLFNVDNFMSHQQPDPAGTDCILWTAGKHRQGYGMCGGVYADTGARFMTVAHRAAVMIDRGIELSGSDIIVHSCGNPLCVNPRHLMIGDLKLRNKHARKPSPDRKPGPTGLVKQNRNYRYTEEEIIWYRTAPTDEIMKKLNISRTNAAKKQTYFRTSYRWLITPVTK